MYDLSIHSTIAQYLALQVNAMMMDRSHVSLILCLPLHPDMQEILDVLNHRNNAPGIDFTRG